VALWKGCTGRDTCAADAPITGDALALKEFHHLLDPGGVADIGLPVAVPRRDRPQRAVQYRKEAVSRRI
jgi:hypothetical protein